MSNTNDTIRYGRFLDTPDRRGDGRKFYSSSSSNMYHGHHHYHPYKRSDKGYFPFEFKKYKPPTFYGDLKKSEDAEA